MRMGEASLAVQRVPVSYVQMYRAPGAVHVTACQWRYVAMCARARLPRGKLRPRDRFDRHSTCTIRARCEVRAHVQLALRAYRAAAVYR